VTLQSGGNPGAVSRRRRIAYWVATVFLCVEFGVGGVWDLLRIPLVRPVIERLGYPEYLLIIVGVWKLLAGVAMLVPRFPRLKEWAYAGRLFSLTGAIASHLAIRDRAVLLIYPSVVTLAVFVSWALRPAARREER